MSQITLYKLTDDFLAVQALLDDPDVDLETIEATLEAIKYSLEEKGANGIELMHYLEDRAVAFEKRRKLFELNEKHYKAAFEKVKEYYRSQLEKAGIKKLETESGTLSLRLSKVVEIINSELVPDQYLRIKTEINKQDAKAILLAGGTVPGLMLQEKLNLQIK